MVDFQKAKLQRELNMARLRMANAIKILEATDGYVVGPDALRVIMEMAVKELQAE
jgi:proteasome assembly chaperone (PAC2) family protein